MFKKFYYILLINFILFLSLFFIANVYAAKISPDTLTNINNQTNPFVAGAGLSANTSIGSIIATVIQAFLGLLGIIFIILILIAGYNWMTAAGDEEKVKKAKETLSRAIIGLIIIIAAYSITYFVFNNLGWGGASTGGPGGSP